MVVAAGIEPRIDGVGGKGAVGWADPGAGTVSVAALGAGDAVPLADAVAPAELELAVRDGAVHAAWSERRGAGGDVMFARLPRSEL